MTIDALRAQGHWVFGYGSLIWNPGFPFVASQVALLSGAHRSLSIYSHTHRGTPERPGLVFGLTRGGSCRGMAFEVAEENWQASYAYLLEREQVSGVYREAYRKVRLADGRVVTALAFLVDELHVQFAGRLELAEQARLIRGGLGQSGRNVDYVINTAEHLERLGLRDRQLQAVVALLKAARDGEASTSSE